MSAAISEVLAELAQDNEGLPPFDESWQVHEFIQRLLDQGDALDLPTGAVGTVYFLDDEDPGFIFSLRPGDVAAEPRLTQVAGLFVSCWDIAGHVAASDPDAIEAAYREVARLVASEFSCLAPAYRRLFASPAGDGAA